MERRASQVGEMIRTSYSQGLADESETPLDAVLSLTMINHVTSNPAVRVNFFNLVTTAPFVPALHDPSSCRVHA